MSDARSNVDLAEAGKLVREKISSAIKEAHRQGYHDGQRYGGGAAQRMSPKLWPESVPAARLADTIAEIMSSPAIIARADAAEAALEAERAKVAALVEALRKIGTLAPVEKPPEPYDENGWQVADTGERHAEMVSAKDMWEVADFARAAIEAAKGESHE